MVCLETFVQQEGSGVECTDWFDFDSSFITQDWGLCVYIEFVDPCVELVHSEPKFDSARLAQNQNLTKTVGFVSSFNLCLINTLVDTSAFAKEHISGTVSIIKRHLATEEVDSDFVVCLLCTFFRFQKPETRPTSQQCVDLRHVIVVILFWMFQMWPVPSFIRKDAA